MTIQKLIEGLRLLKPQTNPVVVFGSETSDKLCGAARHERRADYHRSERGQSFVLGAFIIVALLALIAFVLDGGLYVAHWNELQADIDAACMAAAIAQQHGGDTAAYTAFVQNLQANNVSSEYYSPFTRGADGRVLKGIEYGTASDFYTGVQGPHEFYLAQFMGFKEMDVAARSRCKFARFGVLPIAVQEPWFKTSLTDGTVYPILGEGVEAINYTGNDYAGAVHLHLWCTESDGDPDTNCSDPTFFYPLEPSPNANMLKDDISGIINGSFHGTLPPIEMRLAQVSGTSNNFLVTAVKEAGYGPGNLIVVIIFNGDIVKPEPGYGNWDNVGVIYYAVAEIVEFDANTLFARFVEGPLYSLSDIESDLISRTIPWDWNG